MKTREELLKHGYNLDANSMIYGEKLVKAILSAPTEKQLTCAYCQGEADLNDTANSEFQLNLDMGDENDPRLAVGYGYGFCDYDSVSINYCPICGKKLFNKEQSNENYTTN